MTAPHYTELRDHGPKELARIVAAAQRWRLTAADVLVDEYGLLVAYSVEDAAAAMNALEWFSGDEDGEIWIDWDRTPDGSAAKASTVRSWLADRAAGAPGVRGPERSPGA